MNNVLLFNPRSARSKPRIPNSILSIAAAIEGLYGYVIGRYLGKAISEHAFYGRNPFPYKKCNAP